MPLNVSQLLESVLNQDASDLHLSVGLPPVIRINTKLGTMPEKEPLTEDDIHFFLSKVLTEEQKNILEVNREVDFSVALSNKARFRVNAFFQKGYPAVALRLIPMIVPEITKLNLPEILLKLCELKQGLIIVAGPTGHGKSTTIASMIDHVNKTRAEHIITIEDPIEYIFLNQKSLVEQREMYLDTHSWDGALRAILRQDPNVVFIGEMRDMETMESVLRIAETGHLVFTTLHTNSAAQSIDRIISTFPEAKQGQVRLQLAQSLEAVISQRLLPSDQLGVVPAIELMLGSDAVRSLIREGKTFQLDNVINTSSNVGMLGLDASLALLIGKGFVNEEIAMRYSLNPEYLRRLLKGMKG